MDRNKEMAKSDGKSTPPEVNQDHAMETSDFAMALAMQEQENTQNPDQLDTYDDDDNDDEYSSSEFSYDDEDYEFFENQEGHGELIFMVDDEEDTAGETDIDMEEDDIEPDDMSYEELLALGDIVGEANRGLTDEQISSSMEKCEWHSSKGKTTTDRCVVCQMEFEEGEKLVVLSACSHPYHGDCISKWLQVKKTCPICNTEVSPSVGTSCTSSS